MSLSSLEFVLTDTYHIPVLFSQVSWEIPFDGAILRMWVSSRRATQNLPSTHCHQTIAGESAQAIKIHYNPSQ
jgi:hypothetical protein